MKIPMKRILAVAVAASALFGGAALAAGPVFPLGTYVVTGAAVDVVNALYGKDDGVVIQAIDAKGNVLAETSAFNPVEGVNFRLEIPVDSVASDKAAAVGDEIGFFVLVGANERNASDGKITVAKANGYTSVRLIAAETVEFPTKKFAAYAVDGKVRVTKAYLDELRPWMDAYGHAEYKPDEDWDNDGSPNYLETLGGTNLFDPSDFLRVLDFATITDFETLGTRLRLTFECVQGHTYLVMGATDLKSSDWKAEKVTPAADATPTATEFSASENGTATLYMVPAVDVTGKFFKVEPK